MIYLDNNASTPLAPEVEPCYQETLGVFGNAGSVHGAGREARRLMNESREIVASIFRVPESSLIFTSGGTESLNGALLSAFFPLKEKKHLIVSQVEHAAVLETARFLEQTGVEVTYLPVDAAGRIDPAGVEAAIRPDTAMIAVMFANNEIGNIYPVAEIGAIARRRGIPYLCDGVQAAGKLPIDLSRLPIDLFTASAHKFHGPKGVGLLYVRPGAEFAPLLHGGRQERGRRAGTENVAGVVAMARALNLCQGDMLQTERRIERLRNRLQEGLLQKFPDAVVHGDAEHRLGNTLNLRIPGVSGESALINLDMAGVAVSIGAACDSGSIEPSHVLRAMGVPRGEAMNGLRFSLSRYNTAAEIEKVLEIVPQVVERIRRVA